MSKHRRFGDLVRESGRPEVASLWTSPAEDRPFAKAIKENRVLTVIQEPASQKQDFGQIGFHRNRYASYFVFPRPLPKGTPNRVIGINYELVEEPELPGSAALKTTRDRIARIEKHHIERTAPEPAERVFNVVMRRIAFSETRVTVEASNKTIAERRALILAEDQPFDLATAVIRHEIKSVT